MREVIHNFNADGFESLAAKYAGGRPPTFNLPQRHQIKKIALSRPSIMICRSRPGACRSWQSSWSLRGVVDDISHEGLRVLLREEGVSFQVIKTFKQSNDPDFEAKKNRILELYAIADGTAEVDDGDPTVIICVDEFGPLNLQPHPGKQWATIAAGPGDVDAPRRRRRRATYTRPHGVRHMMGAYDLHTDRLYGHIVVRKDRTAFLRFLRYVRSLHPIEVRIGIVLDNFSPHLSTKKDQRVGEWAAANNVELAYTPTYSSWLNRIEASSKRCVTSPSTALTIPAIASKPR